VSGSKSFVLTGFIVVAMAGFIAFKGISAFFGSDADPAVVANTAEPSQTPAPSPNAPINAPAPREIAAVKKPDYAEEGFSRSGNLLNVERRNFQEFIKAGPKIFEGDVQGRPYAQNGKITGYEIQDIRPNTLLEKLGLQRGDIIKRVDEFTVSTAESPFDAIKANSQAPQHTISILRDGKPQTFQIQVW